MSRTLPTMSNVQAVVSQISSQWSWATFASGTLATMIGVYSAFALNALRDQRRQVNEAKRSLLALVEDVYEVYGNLTAVNCSFHSFPEATILEAWNPTIASFVTNIDLSSMRTFRTNPMFRAAPEECRNSINLYISKVSALQAEAPTRKASYEAAKEQAGAHRKDIERMARETYRRTWMATWSAIEATEKLLLRIDLFVDRQTDYLKRLEEILDDSTFHSRVDPPDWSVKVDA